MNEIVSNLPFPDYVRRDGINASLVSELRKSPMHARAYLDEMLKAPPEPKLHFRIGTLTHRLVLEPGKPLDDMAIRPVGLDGRSKEGREWLKAHEGKMILSQDEWHKCIGMADALLAHPIARQILEEGHSEQSLFADFLVEHGPHEALLQRKGRCDHLPLGNVISDIKTVGTGIDRYSFEKSVLDYLYHVKAAFYLDLANALGLEKRVFLFLAVEKDPPHGVMVYQLRTDAIDEGRQEYRKLLGLWQKCKVEDKWPGYPTEIQTISLPRFAWRQKYEP